MRVPTLVVLALLLAGCHGGESKPQGCIGVWNARENDENRQRVLSADRRWRVRVSQWLVSHPGREYTGTGCSYLFHDSERYLSFSAAWARNGGARWQDAIAQDGRRQPEQNFQLPNAIVTRDGKLIAHR